MSAEESPAQQAARLRRERREAKIKEGGTARLDKITSMSGRTPASGMNYIMTAREEESPSQSPQPTSLTTAPRPAPTTAPSVQDESPEDVQAQQEYFRALLRQAAPPNQTQQSQQQPGPEEEDPAVKLLHSILAGNMPGDEGGGAGGSGAGATQADLLSALGLPPALSSLVSAATRTKSEAEKKETQRWKAVHVVFALVMGVCFLMVIGTSIATYGNAPPPPATAQNPFVLFMTGEMALSGARMVVKRRAGDTTATSGGPGVWLEMVRDAVRDGSLVVFALGMGAWWQSQY